MNELQVSQRAGCDVIFSSKQDRCLDVREAPYTVASRLDAVHEALHVKHQSNLPFGDSGISQACHHNMLIQFAVMGGLQQ